MTENVSSDTLRDRYDPSPDADNRDTLLDAIEYAAQLERSLAMLTADPPSELERTVGRIQAGQRPTLSEGQQLIRFVQRFRAERDEARARAEELQHRLDRLDRGTWEARMDGLYEWAEENIEGFSRVSARAPETVLIEALEEARAERDRALNALEETLVQPVEVGHGQGTNICSRCDRQSALASNIEHAQGCPLREIERGDTVERIRREAFEEAAEKVENLGQAHFYCTQHERHEGDGGASPPPNGKCWQNQADVADAIRALAEADDQEENDD